MMKSSTKCQSSSHLGICQSFGRFGLHNRTSSTWLNLELHAVLAWFYPAQKTLNGPMDDLVNSPKPIRQCHENRMQFHQPPTPRRSSCSPCFPTSWTHLGSNAAWRANPQCRPRFLQGETKSLCSMSNHLDFANDRWIMINPSDQWSMMLTWIVDHLDYSRINQKNLSTVIIDRWNPWWSWTFHQLNQSMFYGQMRWCFSTCHRCYQATL